MTYVKRTPSVIFEFCEVRNVKVMNQKIIISIALAIIIQVVTINIPQLFVLHVIPFIIGFSGESFFWIMCYYILSTLVLAGFFRFIVFIIDLIRDKEI